MKLSHLQKYVLGLGYAEKDKFGRGKILRFYDKVKRPPKMEDRVNIVTKSLERLIDKGFLIGYGMRTPKKWFIKEIKLTAVGKKWRVVCKENKRRYLLSKNFVLNIKKYFL